MNSFDLTSDEAMHLISNSRRGECTEYLFISSRPNDCTFNGTIKGFSGKEVTFTCKGDVLGSIYVIGVAKLKDGYRLEYWGDSFKRVLPDNCSYSQNRLGINDYTGRCEQALHDLWQKENAENNPWTCNENLGLLQELIRHRPEIADKYLTTRERKLIATVIQWLGTNCGRAFLDSANYNATQLTKNSLKPEK